MKKSVVYIVLLVLLVAVAAYLYVKDQQGTLDSEYTRFGLGKDQQVDSVLLSSNGNRIKLHRRGGKWYVNEQIYARKKAVQQFFNLLEDIRIEAPAAADKREILVEEIRKHRVSVKIYQNDRLIRDYLVEQSPSRKHHNYMMVRNSSHPYLMSLPGYQGDLADLYRVDVSYWRDRTLFDYSGLDIKAVEVIYPEDTASSFLLTYQEDEFLLKDLARNQWADRFSSNKAARYFSYFGNVRFHSIIMDDSHLRDSLAQSQPFCTIHITDVKGNPRKLSTYRKPATTREDAFGQHPPYDLNFLYGRFEQSEEILLINYTEIDPLLKEINYFRENE